MLFGTVFTHQSSIPGQVEGVVQQLGAVEYIDGLVGRGEDLGQLGPVLCVVVHSVVTWK